MLPSQDSGFTYSSQYVPPATTTYFVQQPVYNPWGGYRSVWYCGGYRHGWYRHSGGFACGRHVCWR